MTGLIIICVLALLIFLFLRARVGVDVKMRPELTELRLRFGFFAFQILPAKPRKRPKRVKKAQAKAKKKERPEPPEVKKKPFLTPSGVIKLLPSIGRMIAKLVKGITLHRFNFHIIVATGDVAKTAELYGAVHAGLGLAAPLTARVKDADITVGLDYNLTSPVIYLSTALSIRTGTVLAAGLSLLWAIWRSKSVHK